MMCGENADFADNYYVRAKQTSSGVGKLMLPDGKLLAQFNMHLRDSSKYQPAVRRPIQDPDLYKQKTSKISTKAIVHKVSDLTLHYSHLFHVPFLDA